ncbi:MAG TPA: hypothetical protein VKD22_12585 [Ramlibacter sp.]|nr:hypothetical protein [Ramlibacter sp.]
MDQHLRAFIAQWLRVVAMALVPVALTAFISIPLNLGGDPTDHVERAVADGHMT